MIKRMQVLWTSPRRTADCDYITHLAGRNPGGSRWELRAEDALFALQHQLLSLFLIRDGLVYDIVAANYDGHLYLRCTRDALGPATLLQLPAFYPDDAFAGFDSRC